MKKYFILGMATVFSLLLIVPNSFAVPVNVNDLITFQQGNSYASISGGRGGEFIATIDGSSYKFGTFCLEVGEHLDTSGTKFRVSNISDAAITGGEASGSDPIDNKTAWIYYQYVKNSVNGIGNGFAYDGNTYADEIIQFAIWEIEGEYTYTTSDTKRTQITNLINAATGKWASNNGVKALNLVYNSDGSKAQDVLVYVPEPGTLLFLGLSMLGLGFAGRKKYLKS